MPDKYVDLMGQAVTATKMQPPWHAMPAGPLSRRAACSGGRRKSLVSVRVRGSGRGRGRGRGRVIGLGL